MGASASCRGSFRTHAREPAQAIRGARGRAIFTADKAAIAEFVQRAKNPEIVEFARAGLMAPRTLATCTWPMIGIRACKP